MRFPEQISKAWFALNSTPTCQLIGNIRGHQHGPDTMPRILNKDWRSEPQEAGLAKIWLQPEQGNRQKKYGPASYAPCAPVPITATGNVMILILGLLHFNHGQELDEWKLKVQHIYNSF